MNSPGSQEVQAGLALLSLQRVPNVMDHIGSFKQTVVLLKYVHVLEYSHEGQEVQQVRSHHLFQPDPVERQLHHEDRSEDVKLWLYVCNAGG